MKLIDPLVLEFLGLHFRKLTELIQVISRFQIFKPDFRLLKRFTQTLA